MGSNTGFTVCHRSIVAHEASTWFLQISLSWANPVALSHQIQALFISSSIVLNSPHVDAPFSLDPLLWSPFQCSSCLRCSSTCPSWHFLLLLLKMVGKSFSNERSAALHRWALPSRFFPVFIDDNQWETLALRVHDLDHREHYAI